MKTHVPPLAALAVASLSLMLNTAAAQSRDAPAPALRLDVASLRNSQGTLSCRLFTDAKAFPDGEGVRTVRVPIAGAQTSCVFDDLPPGTYAVAVVHDENGNGRLDKNFLGIPNEGYGVSNNRTYAASSPKWDESRFSVKAGEPLALRVALRY
ncbi:MAG: DUF2141 domain-containing protein [Inhella sp.]|jgi:uncharacterized protein (DUF2141 family)|uniref:DUF2141 domain-containing protein n=1 Tax=Inhella sp. TaxID=1921806 RepID=UPI0022C818F1|nr:DUF2141 domain-containing protein [Inhella sp.]MCZ8235935.1 DUF2141 domain-containing protein [Inhella sp.]